MKEQLPPLEFTTGIAHVAPLGPNVVISFSGFEHGSGQDASFPISHRVVMSREQLVQGIEFLQRWLDGASPEKSDVPIQ